MKNYIIKIVSIYFLALIFISALVCVTNSNWLSNWFYGKFYVFQFSVFFIIGCALSQTKYTLYYLIRRGKRRFTYFSIISEQYFLAIIMTTLLFFFIICGGFFYPQEFYNLNILDFVSWYFRYLLGLFLLSSLSSNFYISNKIIFHRYCFLIVFLLLAFETIILFPTIDTFFARKIYLLFSWTFNSEPESIIILLSVICLLNLRIYFFSNKRDVL